MDGRTSPWPAGGCWSPGAPGFLGGAVVRELLARGAEVVGLVRDRAGGRRVRPRTRRRPGPRRPRPRRGHLPHPLRAGRSRGRRRLPPRRPPTRPAGPRHRRSPRGRPPVRPAACPVVVATPDRRQLGTRSEADLRPCRSAWPGSARCSAAATGKCSASCRRRVVGLITGDRACRGRRPGPRFRVRPGRRQGVPDARRRRCQPAWGSPRRLPRSAPGWALDRPRDGGGRARRLRRAGAKPAPTRNAREPARVGTAGDVRRTPSPRPSPGTASSCVPASSEPALPTRRTGPRRDRTTRRNRRVAHRIRRRGGPPVRSYGRTTSSSRSAAVTGDLLRTVRDLGPRVLGIEPDAAGDRPGVPGVASIPSPRPLPPRPRTLSACATARPG